MKTIYRVEHPKDGYGMFASADSANNPRWSVSWGGLPAVSSRHDHFNTPDEDGLGYPNKNEFCAYRSLDQFRVWVKPDELEVLADHGFRLYEITVRDCREGADNILFKRSSVVKQIDITDNERKSKNMKNYVIVSGQDCDGFSSPSITRYENERLAEEAAQHSNEGSDGLLYSVVDQQYAESYAIENGLVIPDYYFDADGEIRDVEPV